VATPTGAPPQAPTAQPAPVRSCPAKLADGVELLGEYEGSGYKEAPYIARRADGQVIQLTQLLHLVAEETDGSRSNAEIARQVSTRFGRRVSAGNIQFLVERKLRPLGVLAAADGSSPKLKKVNPLLALRFRTALVPDRVVSFATRFLWPLFLPPVLALALAGIVALDVWLFFFHGVAPGLRTTLYEPVLLIVVFGFVVLATGFHELGHATACRYGGARPGALGAGIYVVWPVFYCDVTDAYRLDKRGRLRVDLGGIYFNGVFALLCGGLYLVTGFEPLLFVIVLQHLAVFQQLLPLLRLDGYYVISDLTGVPDILTRIRPILRSLLPGREADGSVKDLKPWVRVVVSAYVVSLVPILLLILATIIVSAPRVFATAWDSLDMQVDRMRGGLSGGGAVLAIAGGLQTLALVLPAAGTTASLSRLGHRIVTGLRRWAKGRPPRVAIVSTTAALLLGLAAYTWWPNGDYRPIGPDERATIGGAVRSIERVPSGRPSVESADEAPASSAESEAPGRSPEAQGTEGVRPNARKGEEGSSGTAKPGGGKGRAEPAGGGSGAGADTDRGSDAPDKASSEEPGGAEPSGESEESPPPAEGTPSAPSESPPQP
jgi:putative peptide zinc metalloprotease protein